MSTEEERYFDADDDDEQPESQITSSLKRSGPSTLLSRFIPAVQGEQSEAQRKEPASDDDLVRRKRQKLNDESPVATGKLENAATDVAAATPAVVEAALPEPDTDPEQELARIREKRKREEEEEEEDAFSRKKGLAKGQTGGAGPVKKAGAGGLRLLFGQKSS